MKKLLLIAVLLNTLSCSGQDGKLPDKKAMNVIKKAENVEYYSLDPLSDDYSQGTISGIAKTGHSQSVDNDTKNGLVNLINANKANYIKSGSGKFCPPAPQDAVLFVKGDDTVKLVIDFNCGSYTIVNGTLEYEYDFYNCS